MGNKLKPLRDQFLDPKLAKTFARHERVKRRLNLLVAAALCEAHVRQHGTECEVNLKHTKRKQSVKTVTTITISSESMFD